MPLRYPNPFPCTAAYHAGKIGQVHGGRRWPRQHRYRVPGRMTRTTAATAAIGTIMDRRRDGGRNKSPARLFLSEATWSACCSSAHPAHLRCRAEAPTALLHRPEHCARGRTLARLPSGNCARRRNPSRSVQVRQGAALAPSRGVIQSRHQTLETSAHAGTRVRIIYGVTSCSPRVARQLRSPCATIWAARRACSPRLPQQRQGLRVMEKLRSDGRSAAQADRRVG